MRFVFNNTLRIAVSRESVFLILRPRSITKACELSKTEFILLDRDKAPIWKASLSFDMFLNLAELHVRICKVFVPISDKYIQHHYSKVHNQNALNAVCFGANHDDVIKWNYFPRYWPFVRLIRRSPVNSSHKGQSREALMFSLIYAWTNGWVNNEYTGDLRRHSAHYDVTVMCAMRRVSVQWTCNKSIS